MTILLRSTVLRPTTFTTTDLGMMKRFLKKPRFILFLEIAIYCLVAAAVAVLIILF